MMYKLPYSTCLPRLNFPNLTNSLHTYATSNFENSFSSLVGLGNGLDSRNMYSTYLLGNMLSLIGGKRSVLALPKTTFLQYIIKDSTALFS